MNITRQNLTVKTFKKHINNFWFDDDGGTNGFTPVKNRFSLSGIPFSIYNNELIIFTLNDSETGYVSGKEEILLWLCDNYYTNGAKIKVVYQMYKHYTQ
jgi:hypothetical protein